MRQHKLFTLLILFILGTTGFSQVVTNETELKNAIASASPGSTIILADGTWNDIFIDIDKNGNSTNPITITAQNAGSVIMTGNSRVYMEGQYLTISGLVFQDPANLIESSGNIEPVFELKDCDYCKIINNKIDNYNGTEAQKSMKFKWILADGEYNEIAYNSFIGKYGVGSIINDNRNSTSPDYLSIHHNYFADRTPINGVNDDNDQDAIRIGNSSTSLDDSFSEVYDNYFYNFFGEVEVISNKSGQNKYYNNTFREYSGTLTLRHGDNCEVYGNYFFADKNFFSGGVRVIGEGHKIYNNYIDGINSKKEGGSNSNATGGINVSNGRLDSELSGYFQVKNTEIVNNTFVNCDYALRIGTTVSSDLDQAPENLTVANNIMYNSTTDAYQIVTEPIGISLSEGNITALSDYDLIDDGSFFRLAEGSSAIDMGLGTYDYLSEDILGGIRENSFDSGAEEFGANGMRLPYTNQDVGINVGFGALLNSISTSVPFLESGVCGGQVSFNVLSNVDWTISENSDWLSLSITEGSGTNTVTVFTEENTSGDIRSGSLTINEIEGGSDLSTEITIEQLLTSIQFEIGVGSTTSLGTQDIPAVTEENAYNDDLTNYWTGNPDNDPEVSITFNLDSLHFLTEIGINFWKADERTTNFSVAIASDSLGPFTTVIDSENSAEEGVTVNTEQVFSLGGTIGQYVKFIGLGNSSSTNWTSIANVNIYGDKNCANAASNVFDYQRYSSVRVYPNPSSMGSIYISSEKKILGTIDIYNAIGNKIQSFDSIKSQEMQVNVSHLKSGVYYVVIDGFKVEKFIIANR